MSAENLPHCMLQIIFERLQISELRAVPLVCSAWRQAEAEVQEHLWAPFAPGWQNLHKQVALRSWLFERQLHKRIHIDADALALESQHLLATPLSLAEQICSAPSLILRRLPLVGQVYSLLDALAPRRFKVIIAGPRHSGKTGVLNGFVDRPIFYAERRGSLHVESVLANGAMVELWEPSRTDSFVGSYGDVQARGCMEGTDGLVYVCDGQVGAEDTVHFAALLQMTELQGIPVLVVAAKQDLLARAPSQTVVSLGLLNRPSLRWRVQPCSLVGERARTTSVERAELRAGLAWLVRAMRDESHPISRDQSV
jgi:hypothetical protein